MRVLMFGWEYPPQITGGLGTACQGLAEALADTGYQVLFVAPKLVAASCRPALSLLSAGDIRVPTTFASLPQILGETWSLLRLECTSTLWPYETAEGYAKRVAGISGEVHRESGWRAQDDEVFEFFGGYGANLFAEIERYARVGAHLATVTEFDLIHAHDWMTFPAAIAAQKISHRPFIAHVHATEMDRTGPNAMNERVVDIERTGLMAATKIIAVSHRTARMICEYYGVASEKIRVVHNGTAKAAGTRFLPKVGGPIVVFLGRLTMQKGPEYFLEAAYLVSQKLKDVRFVMAGAGDMRARLIERMAELGLSDRFHFTGFLNETKKSELLRQASCLVMSSVSEPFGLTPVEAVQHGVPVITSKQSGVAEVLSGAIKVDFWDVRRMASALVAVLSSKDLAQQLVEDGSRNVEHLTWQSAALKVENLYQDLVAS